MLALAAINVASVIAFGAVYGAAAGRLVSEGAFPIALVVVFGAAAALWVRTEQAGARGRDAVSRLGRIVFALLVTFFAVPAGVLAPLFALQSQLPPEAGIEGTISRVMVLLLASIALLGLMNLAGGCFIAGSAALRRWRLRGARPV